MNIVGPIHPLGTSCVFELAPPSYYTDFLRHSPPGVLSSGLREVLKKDFVLDLSIDQLTDVTVYYVQLEGVRRDELVYFKSGDTYYHSESAWSQWHSFKALLPQIKSTAFISSTAWFAGTNPNYTHQTVDFFPNLLLKHRYQDDLSVQSASPVFGSPNPILSDLLRFGSIQSSLPSDISSNSIYLSDLGSPSCFPGLSIRAVTFKTLYLVKHISIYRVFKMLSDFFVSSSPSLQPLASYQNSLPVCGYFVRDDNRVSNCCQIQQELVRYASADILRNLHLESFESKIRLISRYSTLVLPPGSDNINAFLFSSSSCRFVQLIAHSLISSHRSPFHSFALMRYLLPFLSRTTFVEADSRSDLLGGNWPTAQILSALPT